MTAPTIKPHPAGSCPCREQVELTLEQLAGIYDGDYSDQDFDTEPPARTDTACNATRCACVEFTEGALIDGWKHCHSCGHTNHLHRAGTPKVGKKVRR